MGGHAVVIYGVAADRLTQPEPGTRSMVDRLLGRTRMHAPTWSQVGPHLKIMDLPAGELEGLAPRFVDYVEARLHPPWAATSTVLEYLRLGVFTVHVRGAASGDKPPEWYVQLTFSACAGMADVSSELAAHWAQLWYRAEQGDLTSRFLKPYGFEPDERIEPDRSDLIFVPLGVWGYGLFNATPEPVDDDDDVHSRYFDIDASALETLDDGERERVLRRLDVEAPPLLPAQSCCCQMCAPDFEVGKLDRVVPFK
jgi:hypothetical protein